MEKKNLTLLAASIWVLHLFALIINFLIVGERFLFNIDFFEKELFQIILQAVFLFIYLILIILIGIFIFCINKINSQFDDKKIFQVAGFVAIVYYFIYLFMTLLKFFGLMIIEVEYSIFSLGVVVLLLEMMIWIKISIRKQTDEKSLTQMILQNKSKDNKTAIKKVRLQSGKKVEHIALIENMHYQLNKNLTLGDVHKFKPKLIKDFLTAFDNVLANQVKEENDIKLDDFFTIEHSRNKQEADAEALTRKKMEITFSLKFQKEIRARVTRPQINHDKKFAQNTVQDQVETKLIDNMNNLAQLSLAQLREFAKYADVKIRPQDNKEILIDKLRYVDILYYRIWKGVK